MLDLEAIARSIDFIEANLRQPITVAEMADAVSYSLFHFSRTFSQITHHTPYDYLMRRRLAEAARELCYTRRQIIDIAFDYQFNNPETFSRAFKRVYGIQPSQARRGANLAARRLMPRLTLAHLEHLNKGPYLRPILQPIGPLRLAGVMTLVDGDLPTIITRLWETVERVFAHRGKAAQPDRYGILIDAADWDGEVDLYLAAIVVDEAEPIDPAWVEKHIPASQAVRFIHKGPTADLPLTLDFIYHTWQPRSGVQLAKPWIIEHYPADPANDERDVSILAENTV
ncbi:MAG: AraC family transcriptional regulator [Anaerolineae bacterium]|nr:AraC family transcriptional regulator [Anaerolineae bacterium]